jgi:hypothetical protein
VLPKISLAAVVLLPLFGVAEAFGPSPRSIAHSKVVARAEELLPEYDYIVIGGGTSGLTVADRLTENGKRTLPTTCESLTLDSNRLQTLSLYWSEVSSVRLPRRLAGPRANVKSSKHYLRDFGIGWLLGTC